MLIDLHHHFVEDFYAQAVERSGGDPLGWGVPKWSVEASEKFLESIGATTAILSLTSPGAPILKSDEEARHLARQANDYCASLRDQKPDKFGFFAALPNLLDTEGSLKEIQYAFDTLKADGVTLFTRYGDGNTYLGNAKFDPIWEQLNSRKAVVFVHPTHPVDISKVNALLPIPSVDFPHETTRTAMDMLLNKNRSRYPDCKIILPHAGGNIPWLISRVSHYKRGLAVEKTRDGISYEETMAAFRSFYFDLALSSSHQVLDLLLKMVPKDHIVYGSDYPYAPPTAITNFRADLESYEMDKETRDMIYFKNALDLIPRLKARASL